MINQINKVQKIKGSKDLLGSGCKKKVILINNKLNPIKIYTINQKIYLEYTNKVLKMQAIMDRLNRHPFLKITILITIVREEEDLMRGRKDLPCQKHPIK